MSCKCNIDQSIVCMSLQPHLFSFASPECILGIIVVFITGTTANNEMQEWILGEMNARCHATRLHVPCERNRGYDSIVPCPQELMNNLAEDYAVTQGWCDFTHKAAHIEALGNVDAGAYTAFKQPALTPLSSTNKNGIANTANTTRIPINTFMTDGTEGRTGARNVRLAFFFTVYADVAFVTRLFKKLYSPTHYYMFHLDASVGSVSSEFASTMRTLADTYSNVYLAQDVPIVYGASTATILLTKAMAWFDKHATGWDYFVPLTGSDYPLIPLARIEEIFTHQQPPMPFVMAWTPGTGYMHVHFVTVGLACVWKMLGACRGVVGFLVLHG